MVKGLVKQDINFHEYPIWFQNVRQGEGLIWKDREGFIYRTGYKVPTKTDVIFLYYLMLYSQKHEWTDELTLSQRSILKGCGIEPGKRWADRLKDSLERWEHVGIKFEGTFYNGVGYQTLHFGIIDAWGIEEETKKLWIRFSPEWLLKIKESNFFKYLDFNQIKTLRSPLTLRLYEILIKSFQSRDIWEIDALKLAAKIPMAEKYAADIIPKIQASTNRINEKTSLKLALNVVRIKRGYAKFIFRKLQGKTVDVLSTQSIEYRTLLNLLPKEQQRKKTIQYKIEQKFRKKGAEYVKRNILYANARANKNYRVFLLKALKEDWGLGWEEDQDTKLADITIEHGQIVTFHGKEHEVQEGNCLHLEDGVVPEGELRKYLLQKKEKNNAKHPIPN